MRRFLGTLLRSNLEWEAISEGDLKRILELLNQYADARLDFVDAAIIAIAERRGITRILTLDRRDFGIVRPRHAPHFEILP